MTGNDAEAKIPGMRAGPALALILVVGLAYTLASMAFADAASFAPDAVGMQPYLGPMPFLPLLALVWKRAPCNGMLAVGAIACALVGLAVLVGADRLPEREWAILVAWLATMGTMIATVAVVFVWRIAYVNKHPQH